MSGLIATHEFEQRAAKAHNNQGDLVGYYITADEWRAVRGLIQRDEGRLERVEAIHRSSTDHKAGFNPYCVGCWEAGGMDGAPNWPCPTMVALYPHLGMERKRL